ncbi:MAG: PEGA domain-containing protein, partial [Treponema sp.]|nr:PEGA domain-containing protein [Treponema sp.]
MKKLFSGYFGAAILVFLLFGFCRGYAFGQEADRSWLQKGDFYEERGGQGLSLKSNPGGARVFIDGIERGTTPFYLDDIRPGYYFIRLVKDGYSERRFRIAIHSGSILDLALELEEATGAVYVRVDAAPGSPQGLPLNPKIYADGSEASGMNLVLPVGLRTVTVRAFGWADQTASVYVTENQAESLTFTMKPAVFSIGSVSLNRWRFNPSNAGSLGTTELSFNVSGPGTGSLAVRNSDNEMIFSRELGMFTTWTQSVRWDGRDVYGDQLPDGAYTMTLDVRPLSYDNSQPQSINQIHTLQVFIDSSHVIRPMTVSSGKSGLLFSPSADLLPPGAFQVEGSLLFGNPPAPGSAYGGSWNSLPFAAAFRFSPLAFLEVAGALNVVPVFDSQALLGLGGSLKWTIINPAKSGQTGAVATGLAVGTVISWAQESSVTPFGMGSGIEVNLPFSAGYGPFSFHLAPALLWTGDEGFPWEGMPRFLLSGGVMYNA